MLDEIKVIDGKEYVSKSDYDILDRQYCLLYGKWQRETAKIIGTTGKKPNKGVSERNIKNAQYNQMLTEWSWANVSSAKDLLLKIKQSAPEIEEYGRGEKAAKSAWQALRECAEQLESAHRKLCIELMYYYKL